MGSLASIRQKDVMFAAPWILMGILPIYLLRWRINVLSLVKMKRRAWGSMPGSSVLSL
uniref:hypothetical protein n=1 Tax=Clostridium sp. NkU-1 TaxID=1095009 RepID=UPI0032616807